MAWLVIVGVIALPVIEIALFIKAAALIGVLPTVAVALLSVMIGMSLLRQQGVSTALKVRAQLEHGELPVAEAFDGMCLAISGFLLVLPGLLTDALGLLLLLPFVRRLLLAWLATHVGNALRAPAGQGPMGQGPSSGAGAPVIDAEYQVVERHTTLGKPGER
jgi:UPF0716 protein FxsA